MSDAGYSVDSLDVKSKIASFEAFNETVRSEGSPERRSNAGVGPASAAGSTAKIMHRSMPADLEEPTHVDSTTTVASQNRKSRLQRAMMNGKRQQSQPEPGSLMQKRLSAKERRLASMQQPAAEQRQPSSRHGNSRDQQELSPTKALTSPSSVSSSRTNRSNASRRSSQQSVGSSNLHSPNMRAATAAAKQHRASHYSNNYQQQHPQHAQHPEQQQSSGSSGEQDSPHYKSNKGGPLSRFHKLKMKGMDHARMAQKRKQAAQKNTSRRGQQADHDNSRGRQPTSSTGAQKSSSPQHAMHQRSLQANQQKNHHDHSPDHPLTDDDATLTSVAQVLDQEQAFARQRSSGGGGTTGHHQASSSHVNHDKPPQMWMGEEKSDKAMTSPPHSYQQQHPMNRMGGGIYPRPSSSSEFEPDVHQPRSPSQYASLSKSGGATPSPQHSSSRQGERHGPRHHQAHQLLHNHHHQASSYQQHYHHHVQQHQQYAPNTPMQSPQYSPHQAASMIMSPQDRVGSGGLMRRSGGSYPSNSGQQFYQSSSNRLEDDDRTFDYGVKDDDSQGSTTFQQQLLEAERKAREQSHLSEGNTTAMSTESKRQGRRDGNPSPLLKTDDPMEQYRQSMENPVMKTTCGVIGAATVGCFVIGPVGMLLGAAAVGIGVGVMQIPEEQRTNMAKKATETMKKVEEQALSASESLSNSCATTYKESGLQEHIPADYAKFCAVSEDDVDPTHVPNIKSEDSEAVRMDPVTGRCGGGVVHDSQNLPMLKNQDSRKPVSPNQSRSLRSKKVACLRHVEIHSVGEIHGLEPAKQPRAWLEVLASADTSNDDKNEAMEEILIMAKDKQRARIFLEEGILDSLMWILCRFFEKQSRKPTDEWANPDISPEESTAARLAATCCVTLGKSHCALIHTEGDLLLMSLYERGTVPEERQLAQMLFEVPHHQRITKTDDPTIVEPSMEVFALKQLNLPQAEEIAKAVKALADGR